MRLVIIRELLARSSGSYVKILHDGTSLVSFVPHTREAPRFLLGLCRRTRQTNRGFVTASLTSVRAAQLPTGGFIGTVVSPCHSNLPWRLQPTVSKRIVHLRWHLMSLRVDFLLSKTLPRTSNPPMIKYVKCCSLGYVNVVTSVVGLPMTLRFNS
jgi:hypothetical protein